MTCIRGLNFYLLYPINASSLTALLYSTPSPVLKVPVGVTPDGVFLVASAPVQYAHLSWLNPGGLYDFQVRDLLSTTESGGFSLSPAPLNQSSLQAYVQYYFGRYPYYNINIYPFSLNSVSSPVYSASGKVVLNMSYLGKQWVLIYQNWGQVTTWYATQVDLYAGSIYVYNASLCGIHVRQFPGVYKLVVGGATYYVENLTVYAFGFACGWPPLSYSSGTVQIQFPNYTLSIPATLGYAYLVTRSLSWAFQAVAWEDLWTPYPCWHLRVYSGNNTVTSKTLLCSTPHPSSGPISGSRSSFGPACYDSWSGPYDISYYPVVPGEYDTYATYNVTTICNGKPVGWHLERIYTGTVVLNGQVVMVQDPKTGQTCGPAGEYVNQTYQYIGCSSSQNQQSNVS